MTVSRRSFAGPLTYLGAAAVASERVSGRSDSGPSRMLRFARLLAHRLDRTPSFLMALERELRRGSNSLFKTVSTERFQ